METIRAQLGPRLAGRSITEAGSHPSAKFADAVEAVGCGIGAVRRRGKYLIIGLRDTDSTGPGGAGPDDTGPDSTAPDDIAPGGAETGTCGTEDTARRSEGAGLELVVHLGMTGRLAVGDDADRGHPHLRAWWRLDDGSVFTFHDVRRFGQVHVVAAGRYETIATLSRLGPEPFSEQFTGRSLWQAVGASRRCIKTQLLSQRPVAGVGNIYADEALWLAGINPSVRRLSRPRSDDLAEAIRTALASGLRNGGTTLRDYVTVDGGRGRHQHHLRCYGRAGEPCERCGTELRKRVIDARGTTWCPLCQLR